jgi:hypothetical protein
MDWMVKTNVRAIRKEMSDELLTEQATRTRSDYIHKLLILNIVTAGIEPYVISENKFLYACSKKPVSSATF